MTLPSLLSLKIYIHIYIFIWHHGGSCLRLHPSAEGGKGRQGEGVGDGGQEAALSPADAAAQTPPPFSPPLSPRRSPKEDRAGDGSSWISLDCSSLAVVGRS